MNDPKRLMEFTDDLLCMGFRELVLEERGNLVEQLDYLGELDRRKLFYQYGSLRAFVVGELGLETSVAEKRIKIARLLRRYPELRAPLEQGKIGIRLIEIALGYRHREGLDDEDFLGLLKDFEGKTVEAASREAARRYPHSIELPADQVRAFNEDHAILSIAIPFEVLETMEEARSLLAHSHPQLSKAELIQLVFTDYLKRHHPSEKAAKPEKNPTKPVDPPFPETVRLATDRQLRELIRRDGYGCSHVDEKSGIRCGSTFALEADHHIPWSDGGRTVLQNLALKCRGHHQRATFQRFGEYRGQARAQPRAGRDGNRATKA